MTTEIGPSGYIDPRNPIHQTSDLIIGDAFYKNFLRSARMCTLSSAQIAFIKSVRSSDFSATDTPPPVACQLQSYTPPERKAVLMALKLKFGVFAAAETLEAAADVLMGAGNWRSRYDKGGIDGALLITCAAIKRSIELRS